MAENRAGLPVIANALDDGTYTIVGTTTEPSWLTNDTASAFVAEESAQMSLSTCSAVPEAALNEFGLSTGGPRATGKDKQLSSARRHARVRRRRGAGRARC